MKVKSSSPKPKIPAVRSNLENKQKTHFTRRFHQNRESPVGCGDQEKPRQKKQVRRRLHNSGSNQERLMNMAEARREIVAALKFHRAAMKQQQHAAGSEKQRRPGTPQFLPENRERCAGREPTLWNPIGFSSAPVIQENLDIELPTKTLGLNLNLDGFKFLDTAVNNPSSSFTSSTSSSPPPPCSGATEHAAVDDTKLVDSSSIAAAATDDDDKESAEIKSIWKQHQMEWDDVLNLVNSAWWFKFSMEIQPHDDDQNHNHNLVTSLLDEVMEFPAWLNTNQSETFLHPHPCSDDPFPDSDLPCLKIEDIDGDWFA